MPTQLFLVGISVLFLVYAATSDGERTPSPSPPPPQPSKSAGSPPRSPPSAAPANCSDELVTFSKCLPYTSSSPNNTTDSPPLQCCNDVASAFASGAAVCFCYFIQKPGIFGFPLNSTRILSLTSLCPMRVHRTDANISLSSLCSSPVNPKVNFTQDSQESTADSDTPETADDSDTRAPADDSDIPASADNSHSNSNSSIIPSWRQFSTSGINSKSGWFVPHIVSVIGGVIHVFT
ncbi:hypothetical protein ACH5RR_031339 [Cinchona calisaya]|uniref:Bifunctional inhibitor/plant lipid transfer protein/seed storage helical domain-containing protein n=1 Tax=Cinchona calisaya TaxID=153742 RepID=A0ABD2YHY8_9GENT